jgi:hypothetical protein
LFIDPWLLAVDSTSGSFALLLDGDVAGGPLRSPTDLNPLGTLHTTARAFRLSLTNTGALPWVGVRLDLQRILGAPSDDIDAISFAEGSGSFGDPIGCCDLSPFFTSDRFPSVQRVPSIPNTVPVPGGELNNPLVDAITFGGGLVQPGQTVDLVFAISNGTGVGTVPDFYLVAAQEPVPEPATAALSAAGIAALLLLDRGRRRRAARWR